MEETSTIQQKLLPRLRTLWASIHQQMPGVAWVLYVLWLLLMITMPHLLRLGGPQTLTLALNSSVLLQAMLVLVIWWRHHGGRSTLRVLFFIALLSWAMEWIGSTTGIPFGHYSYTPRLQPQILHVPLLIPLAWLMMLLPAWGVAQNWLMPSRTWAFALLSGIAVTAWDLFLDPQMVAWELWLWHEPGGYFGIPWLNFAGWILTGMVITLVVRPWPIPTAALTFVYTTTWLLEWVGLGFYFGLPGPALVGGLVMGFFALAALYRLGEQR